MSVNCDTCGQEFAPARSDARYCSGKCRTEAYRVRRDGDRPKRKRAPLTDAFWRATYDLQKVTERIERLSEDDRLPRNRATLSARYSDLVRARDAIEQAMERIGEPSQSSES